MVLDESLPSFRYMFPLFMGGVINKRGILKGIIMEDYSEGGKYRVWEMRSSRLEIPADFRQVIQNGPMEREILKSAFFEVNGQLRLGDLDKIPWDSMGYRRRNQIKEMLQSDQSYVTPHLIRI